MIQGGIGDRTDTMPNMPDHEVEDIEALLNEFGGFGYLYGISSVAILALIAASKLVEKVGPLAIYDTAYDFSAAAF